MASLMAIRKMAIGNYSKMTTHKYWQRCFVPQQDKVKITNAGRDCFVPHNDDNEPTSVPNDKHSKMTNDQNADTLVGIPTEVSGLRTIFTANETKNELTKN